VTIAGMKTPIGNSGGESGTSLVDSFDRSRWLYTLGTTRRASVVGAGGDEGSENRRRIKVSRDGTLKNMRSTVRTATSTEETEVVLVVNSVETAVKVTIPALGTGDFNDLTNEVSLVTGDEINWVAHDTGVVGSGNVELEFISVEFA
jgi:hypothetical protein